MNNRKTGSKFENDFCELLFSHGYWVHNLAQNSAGQPADVIAVKNEIASLIDCKVCSKGEFPFSRIESNQDFAMETWFKCGNGMGWFALLLGDEIYMFSKIVFDLFRKKQSSLSAREIRENGIPIERWLY